MAARAFSAEFWGFLAESGTVVVAFCDVGGSCVAVSDGLLAACAVAVSLAGTGL
jgi:hypothetical protein